MNKDVLKQYLLEAIDAMDDQDVEKLFPIHQQPDLYSIASELIALRGEVKKLANVSLKLNSEVKDIMETVQINLPTQFEPRFDAVSEVQFKILLNQLIDHDDLIKRTQENLTLVPELTYFNLSNFKVQYTSWLQGYKITLNKWQQFLKNTGLVKTGLVGEKFNPQYHEAISTKKIPTLATHTILKTEVTGYIFQQILIRPAKVIVNKL